MGEKKITVVSGGRGSGKTSTCKEIAEEYAIQGKRVAGVLSPAIYQNGKKIGFYALNLETGEQKLAGSNQTGQLAGEPFRHWVIDPQVVNWVNDFLNSVQTCELLIIDELGPLEFQDQKGYAAAFNCLRNAEYQRALVVIRPECVADFESAGFKFDMITIA